ncbi:MAG: FKBP-type peptidyl-prolyl cis-trans isomerase [Syntrophorhabdales bacterium]|jgi:FKBP-type peptidyl-prolyl cis-trans isomerase FklB
MRKWAMAMGILLLAAGLCGAEEPATKTENGTAPAVETEKAPVAAAPIEKAAPAAPKADMDKVSYVIGLTVGREMKTQGVELKTDAFVKGLNDSLSGAKPSLTDAETQQIMASFRAELVAKQEAETKKQGAENRKKEEAFLAENKSKEGVRTQPSGLQYKVLKEGEGKKPTAYDSVTVNYRGTLLDGTEFDSSYRRNQPATFPVGGVIPGWTEALQLMKTGSKYQIFIPSKLAYGEAGIKGVIPPSATLIFEVELLAVKDAAENESPAATGPAKEKGAKKPDDKASKTTGGAATAK